jgi:voltage-gated potassium channel
MILVPICIVAIGTVAYPTIEGEKWGYFDGLYMTVITLTTLGYGEIPEPLSKPGRMFTMCLALGGIFILFYFATDIIRSIVTGELRDLLGKERMDDQLRHLDGHIIVCGFGRMGKIVCDEFERMQQRFVVLDTEASSSDWSYRYGLLVYGDATEDEFLRKARIDRARALMTVVGSDATNLYITLSARLLNSKLLIVSRAEEEEAETKLRKVGANKVISPYLAGAHRAVHAVFKPTAQHFMDMVSRAESFDLYMEEFRVQSGSELAGQWLKDSRLTLNYEVVVAGLIRPNGDILNAPAGETLIEAGTTLIIIGKRPQLEKIKLLAEINPDASITPSSSPD